MNTDTKTRASSFGPALFSALVLSLGAAPAAAATWEILGGTFFMPTVSINGPVVLGPGDPGLLIEGEYTGFSGFSPEYDNDDPLLDAFGFFEITVDIYTNSTGVDGELHAAPTLDLETGIADMSSWYVYWNETEFNQGSDSAQITDNHDGTLTISWESEIHTNPFAEKTGVWTLDVQAVPLPASAWLMGSALLGLLGVARRKVEAGR